MNKITFDEISNHWIIECEPHISMRLKRWFGKLGKQTKKKYSIVDTLENARDLEMFAERFGLELDGYSDKLKARAKQFKDLQSSVHAIIAGRAPAEDFELAIPAREYQKQGAQLALRTRGTVIGDDLGLGKTCVAIAMLTKAETRPAVVVTMAHLPTQWQQEFRAFAPSLRTHVIKQTKVYEYETDIRLLNQSELIFDVAPVENIYSSNRQAVDVLIISYHKLPFWAETFVKRGIKSMVLDECQEARRTESQKYQALKLMADHTEFRVGLSATPIYNYGAEIYNVLEVINPNKLGTRSEFAAEWCESEFFDSKRSIKNPEAFGSYLRQSGLMLRRTRQEVGRELPMLTKVPHHIGADLAKLKEVSASCAELAKFILQASGSVTDKMKLNMAGAEFSNKIRQATGLAKAPFVAEFVKMLLEGGEEKILLAGWHRECYTIWREALKEFNPVFYTGKEDEHQKIFSKESFINGKSRVLCMSLRSGAGLDGLQGKCRTVVHGELDYSPAVHEQFTGRVWRDGQKEKVVSYFLIADAGSDPTVADILGVKREQFNGVINLNAPLANVRTDTDHIKKLARNYLEQIR